MIWSKGYLFSDMKMYLFWDGHGHPIKDGKCHPNYRVHLKSHRLMRIAILFYEKAMRISLYHFKWTRLLLDKVEKLIKITPISDMGPPSHTQSMWDKSIIFTKQLLHKLLHAETCSGEYHMQTSIYVRYVY